MEQKWFELGDIRRRRLATAVWIPLRTAITNTNGQWGYPGYNTEFFGVGTLAVPLTELETAKNLDWSEVGLREHRSYGFKESYKPADIYQRRDEVDFALAVVLEQSFDGGEPHVWHLHQDLVIALGLLREGDVWVCPREGYLDIVRLKRNDKGSPISIEIRSEFLQDYLAARRMALRITAYWERREVMEDISHITWPNGKLEENSEDECFKARTWAIHEGGEPFGSEAAVMRVSRNDVDPQDDVPVMGDENNDNTDSESWRLQHRGRKLYCVDGALWRNEWLQPAANSPRVRGDEVPSSCSFIIDASGKRQTAKELDSEDIGRWLWFSPGVISIVSDRRGGKLEWYTWETGSVEACAGNHVHFGVNTKDLITVYAYDIARLPEWQQRIWMGFNVSPDGKVSSELLSAQVQAIVAKTEAPENLLAESLVLLNKAFENKWGTPIIKSHKDTESIIRRTHRFRAIDEAGLLALAKDIARLIVDSMDVSSLHAIVPLNKGEKRGSLKSLEAVLATIFPSEKAYQALTPLVGVYELRLGDAHLPSSQIDEAFKLVGINRTLSTIQQGVQLIDKAARTIINIAGIINKTDKSTTSR